MASGVEKTRMRPLPPLRRQHQSTRNQRGVFGVESFHRMPKNDARMQMKIVRGSCFDSFSTLIYEIRLFFANEIGI